MPLLEGLAYFRVTARFLAGIMDSFDDDDEPDIVPVTGGIVFIPEIRNTQLLSDTESANFFLDSVTAEIGEDGILRNKNNNEYVSLISPFSPGLVNQGWKWTASFSLGMRNKVTIDFQGHPGEVIDLARYTPVAITPGTITIKGDKGDKGDPGEPGEPGPGVPAGGAEGQLIGHNGTTTEWVDSSPYNLPDTVMSRDETGQTGLRVLVLDDPTEAGGAQVAARKDYVDTGDTAAKARANHTGTQPSATISDLTEIVQDIVNALIQAGTNVTKTYDDAAGTLVINATASGGGTTDPEIVRDVIGTALVAGAGVNIVVNDAGDSINISFTGVLPTRQIISGTGLTGGGDLSADRTLAVSYGATAGTAVQGNDTRVTADQAAGTASIRTLGTGATQAAAGNHNHNGFYAPLRATRSTQTGASYTFVVGDANTLVEGNSAAAQTFTVPSGVFTAEDTIVVRQYGAGQITLAAGSGATARSRGGAMKLAGQYSEATITFRSATEFVVSGDVTP